MAPSGAARRDGRCRRTPSHRAKPSRIAVLHGRSDNTTVFDSVPPISVQGFDVVIVCDFGSVTGGSAQVAILSALGLAERGVRVTFVYAVAPLDPRLAAAGVQVHRIPAAEIWSLGNPMAAALRGIWNRPAADHLSRLLTRFDKRNTIVHFHQWTKAMSASVVVGAAHAGWRSVVTAHDYFLVCPNGALYNFPQEAPCTLRPLGRACLTSNCDSRSRAHKLVRLARSGLQVAAFSRLDAAPAVIHVSDFARAFAERLLPWAARHYTVTNPVVIEPCDRAPAEAHREFVFVGRLVPEKGCVDLARLAAQVGVPVVFVGTGPCEEAIRAANPAARLLGWLPPAEAVQIMRASRALVFPSKWHETSGLVCFEALANGVPVLASARTAAAGIVRHGITGMVVDPDDWAAMSTALLTLQDDDIVAGMSRAAFARYWASPPVVRRHIDDLAPVYLDLLEGAAAPGARIRPADAEISRSLM